MEKPGLLFYPGSELVILPCVRANHQVQMQRDCNLVRHYAGRQEDRCTSYFRRRLKNIVQHLLGIFRDVVFVQGIKVNGVYVEGIYNLQSDIRVDHRRCTSGRLCMSGGTLKGAIVSRRFLALKFLMRHVKDPLMIRHMG